jgi:hypothetical protein
MADNAKSSATVGARVTSTATVGVVAEGYAHAASWALAPADQLLVDYQLWLATGKWKPED